MCLITSTPIKDLIFKKRCTYCETDEEVFPLSTRWTAWGNNRFDFHWWKIEGDPIYLCEDCEADIWPSCIDCGTAMEAGYLHGINSYSPPLDGELLCPECVQKRGGAVNLHVG
ncbi:MAG: hypothetical protein ACTSPI_17005, partial [Candidatus Heimdallarchaeaceae archaeon]